jgi:hypothetical protein
MLAVEERKGPYALFRREAIKSCESEVSLSSEKVVGLEGESLGKGTLSRRKGKRFVSLPRRWG